MPHPRRSLESSRRRRREKRQSREDLAAGMYSPQSIAPQQTQMPGACNAADDSPRQQQQPYQPPVQQPYPPPQHEQHRQYEQHQQHRQQYPESFPQQTSLPMPRQATPQDAAQPRSRVSSGSLSSSPSSSSSSYTEISRQYPLSRFGGFFSTFIKAPSEVRRRRRRRGSGTKKRRGVFFGGGGSNSSHSSINSDMAYGTGFVKKEKDRSTRYSSSVAGSAASGSQQQPQQHQQHHEQQQHYHHHHYQQQHHHHQQQQQQYPQYPAAPPGKPSPKLPGEGKRDRTDEEIIAIGRQLSDIARRANEEDLRAAGKTRPSGLVSAAVAISALRKSRKEAKRRGLAKSKKHRDSSSDESDWESASDDDDSSSDSSSSDDTAFHLAYGGIDSSRSDVALPGIVGAAAAAAAAAASVVGSNPTHRRKSSVVDPRLFGPVNSLRGLVHTPCGFGDEQPQPPPSTGSGSRHSYPGPNSGGPGRHDNDRPPTGGSQADAARRPGSIPLEQPVPVMPISNKVFEAGRRDSRNSYRRQRSDDGSLDPTLSGGVAAAAAAAAARMADRRGPWTEDRIYRDDVRRTRPDPDEQHFERDQAPFEELERRRANPEVYHNRRVDDDDSPRLEPDRQMPDYYGRSSSDPLRDGRTWMELHPEERKESLRYQTTYDAHMREAQQVRETQLRDAQQQQQQQQQQQTARATKAGDRSVEQPTQPVPSANVDPFQYQVADDAFNTPQFNNTPRRPLTPQVVTVERAPSFADPTPASASAPPPQPPPPPPSSMPVRSQTKSDVRLSRKDSFEIERAAEERRRGARAESARGRDPRAGYEYEEEEKEARSILDEAKHSTIPVAAVAVASAIAVEEERSRERRRREYSDDGSRDRTRPHKDTVQEDADRYYRESVIARKIASDEIRSRSKSPDESVVGKWENPQAQESFAIVTPPNMEDREHEDGKNPYAAPNADVKVDNEIYPHETGRFRAPNGVHASRFRSRDSSCERERPLLNIVRPTPVPSPDSTSAAREGLKQPADAPASREIPTEPVTSVASPAKNDSSDDEEDKGEGEATHSSPGGKSVSWGENSTKRFEVESPEARSRAESPNELAETEGKPRPRLSKISQWGKIAALLAAGATEPTTELDRSTASRSSGLPADDHANGAPPVPGPKPASPEPGQMPGEYADDLEFAATVAAGLKESGFDPNIVIDDPAFRRRDSRPSPGTNEAPVTGHAPPGEPAEEAVTVPPGSDVQRNRPQDDLERGNEGKEENEEAELSLTDTEDEDDEKTQKQYKLNRLEKYLQMRQSGEIKPPPQLQESAEPQPQQPVVEDRPATPPRKNNDDQRNMLENFLQRRQSGEIKPPRQVVEAAEPRGLEPVPEVEDEEEKIENTERLEKFIRMRQSSQTEEEEEEEEKKKKKKEEEEAAKEEEEAAEGPETTETGPRHESDPEQPPTRRQLEPEALAELEDSVSDFASPNKPKKKKKTKKRRRDRHDELSTVSSRPDEDDDDDNEDDNDDDDNDHHRRRHHRHHSKLSIPGDEGTELSRVSVPGDEGTVFSVEDWEDWDSSPRSTRKSLVASELSISSRRSTRSKRRSVSERDLPVNGESEPPPYQRDDRHDDRRVSSAASEAYDEERKPERRESKSLPDGDGDEKPVSSPHRTKKPGLFSGIFKSGGKKETTNEKRGSFFEQAGTLGAGVGPASIAADAATALTRSNAADVSSEPENISRGLPGPGREFEDLYPVIAPRAIAIDPQYGDLLPLPPSEPGSPVGAGLDELPCLPESRPDTPVQDRNRRFDKTHRRQRSSQENLSNARSRSYSNTAVPLALLRGIGSNPSSPAAVKPPRTPPRPTSWDSTKEFMPLMLLEHARRGMADASVRGEELPPLPPSEATSDLGSGACTPTADAQHELPPVRPTDKNTIGEAAARYDFSFPGPRTIGNDRPLSDDDYDEPAPAESTLSSSGQSARTADAQAIPSPTTPTTPTRRPSPRKKDIFRHAEESTSADEPLDDFETARPSPADVHDEDFDELDLPPIEPSMLGAIPEFSRPAKFFEDKVPEHSELESMDRVIETLPSIESVPKDQVQAARQGSPGYPETLSETVEELSEGGKKEEEGNRKKSTSISSSPPEAEIEPDSPAKGTAGETLAVFAEVPELVGAKDSVLNDEYTPSAEPFPKEMTAPAEEKALEPEVSPPVWERTRDIDTKFSEEESTTPLKENKAKPVTVEDELEPESYTYGPDFDSSAETVPVFEPLDDVVEAPNAETVDITPVVEELSTDAIAESAQRLDAETVEEIIVGTLPGAKKSEASVVVEDSEDSEADEESDTEGEDSGDSQEDSEDSSEEEEEEEQQQHTEVAKQIGERGRAIPDMTASIETLGAVSVVSTSSKKSKKKKKKRRRRKRNNKRSKAAAAAAAEASHDTPVQKSTILPAVEPAPDATRSLPPAELNKSKVEPVIESSIQSTPNDTAAEAVEETPVEVAKDFVAPEPAALEASEPITREIAEDPMIEKPQEAAASTEPALRDGSELASEHTTTLAETEEPRNLPSDSVESTNDDVAAAADDAPLEWAATGDGDPIPDSGHIGDDKARIISPELDGEKDVEEVETYLVDDETAASEEKIEEKNETLAPFLQEEPSLPEEVSAPDSVGSDLASPAENGSINVSTKEEHDDSLVEDREPRVAEEPADPEIKDTLASNTDELASIPLEESLSSDRGWALADDKERDSEATPEYEQTLPFQELPTIMEEPGLEEADATEGEGFVQPELDQGVPAFNEKLSPILEESMEELLEESAPAKVSESRLVERTADEPVLDIHQAEDQPEQQNVEEIKALEPIAEETAVEPSKAVSEAEDISLEPKMDESLSPSINEVAETTGSKDPEWPPIQLPSSSSDISEPLFTQGDVPSDYPTQQSPAGFEPTQMGESFAIPEEPCQPPADAQTEQTDAIAAPFISNAADEVDGEAGELNEYSVAPVESDVNAPAPDRSDKTEEEKEDHHADTADINPSVEEAERNDEQMSTTLPNLHLPESEPKEVGSLEGGEKSEGKQQASASFDLEPTKREDETEMAPNESAEPPSLEADLQIPVDTLPETTEPASADESQKMEEQRPDTDTAVLSDSAPGTDLAGELPKENLPVASESTSTFPASEEEPETQDNRAMEQPSGPGLELDVVPQEDQSGFDLKTTEDHEKKDLDSVPLRETETIPPHELEPKLEQVADADGSKLPMDDTELETGDSGDADVTESDIPLEPGPSEDARPIHEEEHGPAMEDNDNGNPDVERKEAEEEETDNSDQTVEEVDSTNTLDPSVETKFPQESNITSELEKPTLEAEIEASPVASSSVDESAELERALQTEDSEQMDLAQDGAIAPAGAAPKDPSEEIERATEDKDVSTGVVGAQVKDSWEAKPQMDEELTEPANDRQESTVAEGSSQFKAPAQIIKDDGLDTTLASLDSVADANDDDAPHLAENDMVVADEAPSPPSVDATDAVEPDITETTYEIAPAAEGREVADDGLIEDKTSEEEQPIIFRLRKGLLLSWLIGLNLKMACQPSFRRVVSLKSSQKNFKKYSESELEDSDDDGDDDDDDYDASTPAIAQPEVPGKVELEPMPSNSRDNLGESRPPVSDELVNKETEQSPNTGEAAPTEPALAVAAEASGPEVDGLRDMSSPLTQADEQEDAEKAESSPSGILPASRQDEPTEASLPKLGTIAEDAAAEGLEVPQPRELTDLSDDKAAETPRPPEESGHSNSALMSEPGSDNRGVRVPSSAAAEKPSVPAPVEEDGENAWDVFTGSWGKSAGKPHDPGHMETPELSRRGSPQSREHAGGGQILEDMPLVDEPSEMSTPQRRNSHAEQQISGDVSTEHMSLGNVPENAAIIDNNGEPRSEKPEAQHGDGRPVSELQSEKRDPVASGSPSSYGGDMRSARPGSASSQGGEKPNQWFGTLAGGISLLSERFGGAKKKTRDRDKDPIPTDKEDPKEESFLVGREDFFGGELVQSPVLEAAIELPEPLGPFELLRRNYQVADPIGGLLREASASQISVLPPMDMMSELSDYRLSPELSDYRLSPPRALPAVEELPEAEAEATASEVGFYRDSGFSGSLPSRSRRHSTSTIPLGEDEEKQRDSGVDGDWVEAAMAQLKTPEPMNRTPERRPQRRLRRSTLGGQRQRDATSLRDAAQDDERKTIPGTRERVLTGTGTRPETPSGRSSPTRKGYGAIAGMGLASRLSSGRASPTPASTERSDTPPALRRSATSPPVAGPLRSLRRSAGERQRTPERLKASHDGTMQSSPDTTPPPLRRTDKRVGGDLRSLRQKTTSAVPTASEAPVANEGRVRAKDKTDIYDGYGEGRIGSPLSPTRPHSMRRRQSMQVLELEARVEQLIAENRLLSDSRHSTEQHLSHRVVTALSDRDTQIESLKQTLKFLRGEVSRLTEVNDGLASANAELANKDHSRYADLQVHADRGGGQDALVRAVHEKDVHIADLTAKLDAAKDKIHGLQRQILESKAADVQFLNIKDEDYFDHRCQQLCSHVQQWVLRFSKFSDMRACRLTSEINDEKIIDRLDNAILDGSDVDRYLNDRVRRRDIFMSMTMNMIWEFVFTRYLFGMDREQRQKLKSLEKLLTEVGPAQAVRQWRAVTLTLLSKRDSFKRQRDLDTEAVVQAIYQTLCKVLPPPSNLEAQIQAQLRRVMHEAVHLSIEMRTQKAEYMMLPPLQPEYDADGELVQTVQFNASMMSERSGSLKLTNEELEAHGAIVRVVLFPLVVKKGDDDGSNDEEIVVCPAQVLIARSKLTRQPTPSTDGGRASAEGTGRLSGGTNSPDSRPANAI
ncbi:involucrin repeat [Trichoderma cornu-damae]|uniref:Involucrin repeat n=1 Tax=Trichoderma cornu-damae TaxID=654480 RepID=A0A9P8TXN9_9HYPO|nr:involucrin repeat [Trichoderma cornu-damae]